MKYIYQLSLKSRRAVVLASDVDDVFYQVKLCDLGIDWSVADILRIASVSDRKTSRVLALEKE